MSYAQVMEVTRHCIILMEIILIQPVILRPLRRISLTQSSSITLHSLHQCRLMKPDFPAVRKYYTCQPIANLGDWICFETLSFHTLLPWLAATGFNECWGSSSEWEPQITCLLHYGGVKLHVNTTLAASRRSAVRCMTSHMCKCIQFWLTTHTGNSIKTVCTSVMFYRCFTSDKHVHTDTHTNPCLPISAYFFHLFICFLSFLPFIFFHFPSLLLSSPLPCPSLSFPVIHFHLPPADAHRKQMES